MPFRTIPSAMCCLLPAQTSLRKVIFLCFCWDGNSPCERHQSHQQPPAGHHRCVVSQSGYRSQNPRGQLQSPSCRESTPQWPPSATQHPFQYTARGGWLTRHQNLSSLLSISWRRCHSSPAVRAGCVLLKCGKVLTRSSRIETRSEESFHVKEKE